jgi:hypothetical protein
MGMRKAVEKSSSPSLLVEESSELPAHPADKIPIDVVPNTTKYRRIETPKVGVPTSRNWIENPRKAQQCVLVLQLDTPVADASVNLFYTCRFDTCRVRYIRVTQTRNSADTGRHLVEVMAFPE